MALYRAKVRCFVANGMREEGVVFDYEGPENTNLEPVDKPAKDAEPEKAKHKTKRSDSVGATA